MTKKLNLDLGLDEDRIFTNVLTGQEENKYVKKYLTTFKKKIIEKKLDNKDSYYIIKQQQLIIYKNKFYDVRYANVIEKLLDNHFTAEYISEKLCLDKKIIKDLLMMFPEKRKDIIYFE